MSWVTKNLISSNILFVHFLCLPKENEPKEKAPFARWFASDHEIFALHAMFREKRNAIPSKISLPLCKRIATT